MSKENHSAVTTSPTMADVDNSIIKWAKATFPIGQRIIRKSWSADCVAKVEDYAPNGLVVRQIGKNMRGEDYEPATIGYRELYMKFEEYKKVNVETIEVDLENIPEYWQKKAQTARGVIDAMIKVFATSMNLDLNNIQEKEQVYRMVVDWMNMNWFPKNFKSSGCVLTRHSTAVSLYDDPSVVIRTDRELHIGFIKLDQLKAKVEAAHKDQTKTLVNKHDLKKINDAQMNKILKKNKSKTFTKK